MVLDSEDELTNATYCSGKYMVRGLSPSHLFGHTDVKRFEVLGGAD